MTKENEQKKCDCENMDHEIIIKEKDPAYNERNVAYYHCDECGEYFKIIDFDTKEVLFENCNCSEKHNM